MKKTVLLVEETETMTFELKLPELPEYPDGFPDYWLNILFRNNPSTVLTKAVRSLPPMCDWSKRRRRNIVRLDH